MAVGALDRGLGMYLLRYSEELRAACSDISAISSCECINAPNKATRQTTRLSRNWDRAAACGSTCCS